MSPQELAPYIDHTLLKAEATKFQIETLCQEAREYKFYAVCVNSRFVELCQSLLSESPVKIASVVGFPLGANASQSKAFEAELAVKNGAHEIDMVISLGAIKEKDWAFVENDIATVVRAVPSAIVKVILETGYLNDEEKINSCKAVLAAGGHFVKTSTGFGPGGASVEDVLLMKKIVGEKAQVKASGGVRDLESAKKVIAAGATRIGTSSGVAIINSQVGKKDY